MFTCVSQGGEKFLSRYFTISVIRFLCFRSLYRTFLGWKPIILHDISKNKSRKGRRENFICDVNSYMKKISIQNILFRSVCGLLRNYVGIQVVYSHRYTRRNRQNICSKDCEEALSYQTDQKR